jgi:hypothetical protein
MMPIVAHSEALCQSRVITDRANASKSPRAGMYLGNIDQLLNDTTEMNGIPALFQRMRVGLL